MVNCKTFFLQVLTAGFICLVCLLFFSCNSNANSVTTGNVIFIHPDGTGAAMWGALRLYRYGPDSLSNWEKMNKMGLYRSHVLDASNSSSNGGATIHGYGVKTEFASFGNTTSRPVKSLSGKDYSIITEAHKAGMATALLNSGHICEPGTAAFVANSDKRSNTDDISLQIINSGVDIIMAGGETMILPEGVIGRQGQPGIREDGLNLINLAKEKGYTVVFTRDELLALPSTTNKVFGIFAADDTFNDQTEEELKAKNLPLYGDQAPTLGEMVETTLRIFTAEGKQFMMVAEEEATDNFPNHNNAAGTLEALRRADEAIGVALDYINEHPRTLLLTAADSEAGGMQVYAVNKPEDFNKPLAASENNGAPLDGCEGTATLPFVAAPDKNGTRLRFGIAWACFNDVAGGVIARAHGLNENMLHNNVDNTDIYRLMYATLFGRILPAYIPGRE